jgi:hypothetical protein
MKTHPDNEQKSKYTITYKLPKEGAKAQFGFYSPQDLES